MRKYILSGIAALSIVAVATFNVNLNSNSNSLSDISLASIEALANPDNSGSGSGSISGGVTGNGVYAKASYGWKWENGIQVQAQVGCETSYSGQCTWNVGIGISYNF
jgi:hypothetical protein